MKSATDSSLFRLRLSAGLRLVFFALFFTALGTGTARADRIDDVVREQMKARHIPGLALVVLRDGKVIRSAGYGIADLESGVPVTPDAVFEIGSISKQFASEAVMLLVEDGAVRLDDPVGKYLGQDAPAPWAGITVRDLLNHTSGIRDWTELKDFSYRREYSSSEFLALVRDLPVLYAPRSNWSYSNTNPVIAGIIVERVSGRPYEEFVNDRILRPLALPTLRFRHAEDVVQKRAKGYEWRDGKWENGEPFRPRVIAPSGGMLASVGDLARWWNAALGGRIVRKDTLDQMLAPAKLSDGRSVSHGFAFFTNTFNGHRFVFHNGSTVGGFGAGVYSFPDDRLTVAVAGNLEDGGFGAEHIIKRIAGRYIPGAFIGDLPDRENALAPSMLALLRDIAAGRTPDSLTASFAGRIAPAMRSRIAADLASMKGFAWLASERIGASHFVLDGTLTDMHYFRMKGANGDTYYHFRVDRGGKVGFIVIEN